MRAATLIQRSLGFYWRTHAGVLLGAAVASAVLVGALVVGDSVRFSLQRMAIARLGNVSMAVAPSGRLFREKLGDKIAISLVSRSAPVLHLRGTVVRGDGSVRANRAEVLGVDSRFWGLGAGRDLTGGLPEDAVLLNERLAAHLGVGRGDEIVVRVEKPSALSRDAPLVSAEDASLGMRVTVAGIVGEGELGTYSLRANPVPPFNVFAPLRQLQKAIGQEGRANTILVGETEKGLDAGNAGLRDHWRFEDAGLELSELKGQGRVELRTKRVFLDPVVAAAARKAFPEGRGVLTYLVNEIRHGERATPYSMVTALGPGEPLPEDMKDDEIVISQWLAADLAAGEGDAVTLKYYVVGPSRKLEERTSVFRVRAIVPTGTGGRSLMPEYPGLDTDNCRDWPDDTGIDTKRIRDKDEAYWDKHKGTPKAFLSLAAGQGIWDNRFGNLTAVRVKTDDADLAIGALRRALDPAAVGLSFTDVRRQALAATTEGLDFGQLFVALSFFLIVAAVLLMALLFVFGVEQRQGEMGTLLALGFPPRRVLRLMLVEGCVLAAAGCVFGTALGTFYTRAVLGALSGVWSGAVADSPIQYHADPVTLAIGGASGLAIAAVAMWMAIRRKARRPARELLSGAGDASSAQLRAGGRRSLWAGVACVAAALALVALVGARRDHAAAGAFFGAGGLLLVGGLALCHSLLCRIARGEGGADVTRARMGWRNAARQRTRSLAVVGLLACGSFLVIAIGAFRKDPAQDAHLRTSGAGGFALMGETALPVVHDFDTEEGRDALALDAEDLAGTTIVPVRVLEGDDASCLNLNRAQKPRLIAVDPPRLEGRFSVIKGEGWDALAGEGVPAIGDEATVTWGLGKGVGDTIAYTDERGGAFDVRIVGVVANSILQGSLIVSERAFIERFPSEAGYRMFLIDTDRAKDVAETLSFALETEGLEITATADRLAELGRVESTYLSIFQALGGLGMLLGSVGLGVVVLRNVLERRAELALLRAVGFRKRALVWIVLGEHWVLVVEGLGCGLVAAAVAVIPALRTPGAELPVGLLAATAGGLVASGLLWTWLAAMAALRSPLLPALRNE